jgi:hypothetical protein
MNECRIQLLRGVIMENRYANFLRMASREIYNKGLEVSDSLRNVLDKNDEKYEKLSGSEMAYNMALNDFFNCANAFLVKYDYLGLQDISVMELGKKQVIEQFAEIDEPDPSEDTLNGVCCLVLDYIGERYDDYIKDILNEKREKMKLYYEGMISGFKDVIMILKQTLKTNGLEKKDLFPKNKDELINVFFE